MNSYFDDYKKTSNLTLMTFKQQSSTLQAENQRLHDANVQMVAGFLTMKSKYSTSLAALESTYQGRFDALATRTEMLLEANKSKLARMTETWKSLPNAKVTDKCFADFKRLQQCDVSTLNATIAQCAKKIDNLAADDVTRFDFEQKEALKLMKATSLTAKTNINSKLTDTRTNMDASSSE